MLTTPFIWLIHGLLVLLTVAFFTLFERKVIGLIHLRVGPNKVSFTGILQPLLDAFKLLTKQNLVRVRSNKAIYSASPLARLATSLLFWVFLPTSFFFLSNSLSFLGFLALGSILVLIALITGWASNSKYSFVGSLRSVAQSVSYESVITTLVILFSILAGSYSLTSVVEARGGFFLLFFPLWYFCLLAETHRAPFDFAERESELVSGYNTEYGGALFAFLFLREYCVLLFASLVCFVLFLPALPLRVIFNPWVISLGVLVVSFRTILVRVTFCRFRYDFLINLAWKILLPLSLCGLSLGFWFL